jgi:hypothetical protein
MTLRVADLIAEPCTESWDAMTPGGAGRRCDRCSKTVVDLDGMTEAQIVEVARPGTCVRLPTDAQGRVRVAPAQLVPLARLRRHHAPVVAAAMAMMIACTPHARPVDSAPAKPEPVLLESVSRRDDGMPRHMLGAVAGTPRVRPTKIDASGVACDTLPSHPLGHPARGDDYARGLVGTGDLAKADLLAFCDP